MSPKFVFALSLIFTVFEYISSFYVISHYSAAENRQPSISTIFSGDLKADQNRDVLRTDLKNFENASNCSSRSWNSPNCTGFPQMYFDTNNSNINKEKETVLPPHKNSSTIAALSINADNISLHDHPVKRTTIGKNMKKRIIMSYVVGEPREIKNFSLNSAKYTNLAKIRSIRESPRMRRARATNEFLSKTLFKEDFVSTELSTEREKLNGKFRKKRHWPEREITIESPRNRRIRVAKKFPAEFESVLKRVFPDTFATTVRNNYYYRSGDKIQESPERIILCEYPCGSDQRKDDNAGIEVLDMTKLPQPTIRQGAARTSGYETDFLGFNPRNPSSLKSHYLNQPFHESRQKEFLLFRTTNENGDHTLDSSSFTNHLWPPVSRTIASDETKSPFKFRVQLWPPVSSTKISDKMKTSELSLPLNPRESDEEEIENFYKTKSSFMFIASQKANKSNKTEAKHSEKEERFMGFHSLTSPSRLNKAEMKYFHMIKNPFRFTNPSRLSELDEEENTHSAKANRRFQFTISPGQIKLRKAVNENSDEIEVRFRFTVPSWLSKEVTKNSDETKSPFRFTVPPWLNKPSEVETENSETTKSLFHFTVPPITSKSSKTGTKSSEETSVRPTQSTRSETKTTPIPIEMQSKNFSQTERSKTTRMIGKPFGDTNTKLAPNIDYHYHFHHFEGFNWETLPTLIRFD